MLIPAERYISRDFMELEWEHVWTKVWLLGGRSDDIPEPGDYICTDIGKESVLIVRQPDGSVKAFHNVCLHRGNRLRPEGIGKGAENFRCMYHHWTYGLDGAIEHIPDLSSFPQGCPPGGRIQAAARGRVGQLRVVLAQSRGRAAATTISTRCTRISRPIISSACAGSATSRSSGIATGRRASTPSTKATTSRAFIRS